MSEVKKMSVTDQAEVRKDLYAMAIDGIEMTSTYSVETVSDGALVSLGEGQYALIKIVCKDATKFDVDECRKDYRAKLEREAERAEKMAATARKKAEKEKAKAEKAKGKDKKEVEIEDTPAEVHPDSVEE